MENEPACFCDISSFRLKHIRIYSNKPRKLPGTLNVRCNSEVIIVRSDSASFKILSSPVRRVHMSLTRDNISYGFAVRRTPRELESVQPPADAVRKAIFISYVWNASPVLYMPVDYLEQKIDPTNSASCMFQMFCIQNVVNIFQYNTSKKFRKLFHRYSMNRLPTTKTWAIESNKLRLTLPRVASSARKIVLPRIKFAGLSQTPRFEKGVSG